MGVAIAVPMNKYDIIDTDITTISFTKNMPRNQSSSGNNEVLYKLSSLIRSVLKSVNLLTSPPENPWNLALSRYNQMLMVRLKPKMAAHGTTSIGTNNPTDSADGSISDGAGSFVVGTYHMPCMFQVPQVMVIHSALSAQCIEKFAKDDPYIYAGDFNIKPDSSMYTLLTTGSLEETHPDFPHNVPGDTYELKTRPLRSAYKEADGAEPNFTNYAKPGDAETFIDTLDYIFLSDHWKVTSVEPIPHRDVVAGPLPNKDEPSDHLLLGATLKY
jgi:hypothetical protein